MVSPVLHFTSEEKKKVLIKRKSKMNAHYGKLDPFEFEQAEKEKPKCDMCFGLFKEDELSTTLYNFKPYKLCIDCTINIEEDKELKLRK